MWIDNISKIIYEKCLIDDKKEYWSMITDDRYIYLYCLGIKDRPEMYNKITGGYYVSMYCQYVKDRPELYDKLNIDK